MGNKFYKLLVLFQTNEIITRKRLLRVEGITEDLIDEAVTLRYLIEFDTNDIGDIRYIITDIGKQKRDS